MHLYTKSWEIAIQKKNKRKKVIEVGQTSLFFQLDNHKLPTNSFAIIDLKQIKDENKFFDMND